MSVSSSNEGVVLRWRSYGESDKIVTFLTRESGRLTGIGKGAKRSRRRFAGSLDPLARVRVQYRRYPGRSLAFLELSELLEPPGSLQEPRRFAYASYLAELGEQLSAEEHANPELYDLLVEGLRCLRHGSARSGFLRAFELRLLDCTGFAPRLDVCGRCHERLDVGEQVHLDPAHGVFSCESCTDGRAPASHTLSAAAISALSRLREGPLSQWADVSLRDQASALARLTGHLLASQLTRELRSVHAIRQLRAAPDGP